ncbi:MAG: GNAT family N-acetyltransferase [Elusimicrobia bacterium]|nr:GNAT family N-acetyltransferase [Elusimicrobiota bacterium]
MKITIRPLCVEDALTSYKWRNNPNIWRYTLNKPNMEITPEIETEWIKKVLNNKNEKRFAIISDGKYVGNVYLTNIEKGTAKYHIFIGEESFWGKGIATEVLKQILAFAKNELKLKTIYFNPNTNNLAAIKILRKMGFIEKEIHNDRIKVECTL